MILSNVAWIWKASGQVYQGRGFIITSRRVRFFLRALGAYGALKPFIRAPQDATLGKLIAHRPETVGAVIWPYQCAGWNSTTRLARIREHCAIVDRYGWPMNFQICDQLRLLELDEIHTGLKVVLDQPRWFLREGQLAINLFVGDVRIYTLAFSLFEHSDRIGAFVGSIQGRDIEGIVEQYRELTKASCGMHPRDLLIRIFQIFCERLGISQILAVADEFRVHRDRGYFSAASIRKLHANYNDIWTERGGAQINPMFFELSVGDRERSLDEMSSTKRKKYRRKLELIGRIKSQLNERCGYLAPTIAQAEDCAFAVCSEPKQPLASRLPERGTVAIGG
jgi:uncharacterized protein